MANSKYEITDIKHPYNSNLRRIRALVAIAGVVAPGELGGYVETESNLSVSGDAWVSGNARVSGDAQVANQQDWLCLGPLGSRNSVLMVTFRPGVLVSTGCFRGTLAEFEEAVKATHANTRYGREYMAAIKLIELLAEVAREEVAM